MRIRWYRLAVLVLWLAATSWLVVRKILPPLLIGEPPVYATVAMEKQRPPVAWYLNLNENRIGWALSEISRQSTDVTEIHSLVHFDGLPLDKLLPVYLPCFRPSKHPCRQKHGDGSGKPHADQSAQSTAELRFQVEVPAQYRAKAW